MKNAVVLLSGGLDSATTLALAQADGYSCHALGFHYGQRHAVELSFAKRLARNANAASFRVVHVDLRAFGGSALTADIDVPKDRNMAHATDDIPITYVPARNTIFLSFALGLAEVLEARDIFVGANAVDYSGYPDCRPQYLHSFEVMANLATRIGVEAKSDAERIHVRAPLLHMSKAKIIQTGSKLGVRYHDTWSCYDPVSRQEPPQDPAHDRFRSPKNDIDDVFACGHCDSCILRRRGFIEAHIVDPTRYAHG